MKKHLKRFLAPTHWKIPKKVYTWVTKPSPGPHPSYDCIPLQVLIRDVLKLAEGGKETKQIIKARNVCVDGKVKRDPKYPVGLFDLVWIPKLKKHYRIVLGKHGLMPTEVKEQECKLKLFRVEGKTWLRGKRLQLNLSSGKNLLVEQDKYKVGDSLLLEVPENKVIKHFKLEPGCLVLITKGTHRGKLVRVVQVLEGKFKTPPRLVCACNGNMLEVLVQNAFVVGEEQPAIKVT